MYVPVMMVGLVMALYVKTSMNVSPNHAVRKQSVKIMLVRLHALVTEVGLEMASYVKVSHSVFL